MEPQTLFELESQAICGHLRDSLGKTTVTNTEQWTIARHIY